MLQMLFSVHRGQLIPKLEKGPEGLREPDGETFLDVAQASAAVGLPEDDVRAVWVGAYDALLVENPGDARPPELRPDVDGAREYYFARLNDEQWDRVLKCARMWGLEPAKGQLWARVYWDYDLDREAVRVQPTIMGLRAIAHRTGEHAGTDDAVFTYGRDERLPDMARVTVYRLAKGKRRPHTAGVAWDEYFPGEEAGQFALKMPRVWLGKCAEAAALRKAFPEELGGMYIEEELAKPRTRMECPPERTPPPAAPTAPVTEDDEFPTTSMAFHLMLVDPFGIKDPNRRNALIQQYREMYPGLLERDAPAFYRVVIEALMDDPRWRGPGAPESGTG